MPAARKPKRPRGRPRGGGNGERVRDYPAVLVRLPPATREILTAVAQVRRKSNSQLMTDMIVVYYLNYLKNREPEIFARVDEVLRQLRKPATATRQEEPGSATIASSK